MKLPQIVSKDFVKAAKALHPNEVKPTGGIAFFQRENDGPIELIKWDIETPPTLAEVNTTNAAIEAALPGKLRAAAYLSESDALVIRAMRLQLAGDPNFDAAKNEALAKVAEIKERHPDKE